MGADYIPEKDHKAAVWMKFFSRGLVESPQVYHATPEEAAQIDARVLEFRTALAVAHSKATNTRSAILTKNISRRSAEAVIRPMAQRIRPDSGITAVQKLAIGLKPPAQRRRKIPVPRSVPVLRVRLEMADYFTIFVHDSQRSGRARPKDASGMELWERIIPKNADGSHPPADDAAHPWVYLGVYTSTPILHRPQNVKSGDIAAYKARWVGTRGEPGMFGSPFRLPAPFNSATLMPMSLIRPRKAA